MNITIEKNNEDIQYIDHLFTCNIFTNDPRDKKHMICIDQHQGLFRINKADIENPKLLIPTPGNDTNRCYFSAATGAH